MADNGLNPLNWQTPIVHPETGRPTNFFIRQWQDSNDVLQGVANQISEGGEVPIPQDNSIRLVLSKQVFTAYSLFDGSETDLTGASGTATLMRGGDNITSLGLFSLVQNGLTATIDPSGNFYVTALSSDNATLTIECQFDGVTYSGVFSVTRFKSGYEIVSSLPTTNLFEGRIVFLESTGKLNVYTNGEWSDKIDSEQLAEVIIGGSNLVQDGNFEQIPTSWQIYQAAGSGGSLSFSDSALAPGNGRQVRMTAGTAGPLGITRSNVLSTPWLVGKEYVVSFWARPSSTSPNISGFTLYWNTPAPTVEVVQHPVPSSSIFQKYIFKIKYSTAPFGSGTELFPSSVGAQIGESWLISGLQVQRGNFSTEAEYLVKDAIIADHISAGSIIAGKIGASAVTTLNLAAKSVTASEVKFDGVTISGDGSGNLIVSGNGVDTLQLAPQAAGVLEHYYGAGSQTVTGTPTLLFGNATKTVVNSSSSPLTIVILASITMGNQNAKNVLAFSLREGGVLLNGYTYPAVENGYYTYTMVFQPQVIPANSSRSFSLYHVYNGGGSTSPTIWIANASMICWGLKKV